MAQEILRDTWSPVTETVPRIRVSRWRSRLDEDPPVSRQRFEAFMNQMLGLIETDLAEPVRKIETLGHVDDAEGVWLDFIGGRLGLPRPRTQVVVPRFGFGPAQVAANAPTAASPPVPRVGFNQGPFYTRRPTGTVAPIADSVYRSLLRARGIALRTKWCPQADIELAAQHTAELPGRKEGGFVLSPARPQVEFYRDADLTSSTTDAQAVAADGFADATMIVAVATSATEATIYRVSLSPYSKSALATVTGTPRGLVRQGNDAIWLVLGATLHTFTFSTATLDAGTAITGIGAGQTIRGMAASSTAAYLHTGSQLYSLDTGTAAATAVGAAITDDDLMIVGLTLLDGTLYGLQADGAYVSLDTGTAAATETGDTLDDEVAAVGGFALTSNEDDTRVVVLGVDGRLFFYDPVMSAASLTYAVYLGGVLARTVQALVQASEDPTDDDVSAVILPRPAGINARVRVI